MLNIGEIITVKGEWYNQHCVNHSYVLVGNQYKYDMLFKNHCVNEYTPDNDRNKEIARKELCGDIYIGIVRESVQTTDEIEIRLQGRYKNATNKIEIIAKL